MSTTHLSSKAIEIDQVLNSLSLYSPWQATSTMNSLLDLESVVKLWCNKEIHESNSTYGVYGATENYRLDSSRKPKVTVDNVKYKPRRPIQLPGLTFTEWSDNATNEPVYSKFMKSTTVESTRSASVTNGLYENN